MKQQVIVIHGADTFDTHEQYLDFLKSWEIDFEEYRSGKKGWKSSLPEKLGESYEVISPSMPCKINAKYAEWKIWFDKFVPYFTDNAILVGHSMGGIFLAKYLAQNQLPKKIKATFLVAAPFDGREDESLADFALPGNLSQFEEQGGKIFLYHSRDDDGVPFSDLGKYQGQLPNATVRIFEDRGHFLDPELPELVADIENLRH